MDLIESLVVICRMYPHVQMANFIQLAAHPTPQPFLPCPLYLDNLLVVSWCFCVIRPSLYLFSLASVGMIFFHRLDWNLI
jgi:hypothetical protein